MLYTLRGQDGDLRDEEVEQSAHVPRVGELVCFDERYSYQVVDVLWHLGASTPIRVDHRVRTELAPEHRQDHHGLGQRSPVTGHHGEEYSGGGEPGGGSRWTRVWREIRITADMLVDVTRRPTPAPVLYLRCGSCGKVAPRTVVRRHGSWSSDGSAYSTPPEYPCPLCESYAPRVVGDQFDPGDPNVDTVTMTCTVRFGCLQFWRHCATTFTVPVSAVVVLCPACGERYPGPGA